MKIGKIVTIVPSRLGSNRVPMKGMRILGDRTLIEHTISSIQKSKYLSEKIYINSDAIEWNELAEELGVSFFHRSTELATSKSMIDDYLYDFMTKIESDYVAVITPTAPFLTSEELDNAWLTYSESDANTLISAEGIQTHCFYNGKSLNFNTSGTLPRSQDLEPIHALNFSIAIYDTSIFRKEYEKNGFAVLAGKIQTFLLEGFSTIDIDEEKDFILAELALQFDEYKKNYKPSYSKHIEKLRSSIRDTRN
ncbi:MAG: CMP-N-acetylneuraminic acid synthetase [Salibacteraceae bacterium]|jgi:CMP-N-acetylneuraminic acid synthetase